MNFFHARSRMVDRQLVRRGIEDPHILDAFRRVPREEFVPADLAELAYDDGPLPIGAGQTISQPYIVAVTIVALQLNADDRVLEVGTGSGYAAALFSLLAREVFTIERIAPLAETARARLARLGYPSVRVCRGDGTRGWPEHAPYDAVAIAAGSPVVPKALLGQLALRGRLVMPIGPNEAQVLTRITRTADAEFREEPIAEVRFVPLIGESSAAIPPAKA